MGYGEGESRGDCVWSHRLSIPGRKGDYVAVGGKTGGPPDGRRKKGSKKPCIQRIQIQRIQGNPKTERGKCFKRSHHAVVWQIKTRRVTGGFAPGVFMLPSSGTGPGGLQSAAGAAVPNLIVLDYKNHTSSNTAGCFQSVQLGAGYEWLEKIFRQLEGKFTRL